MILHTTDHARSVYVTKSGKKTWFRWDWHGTRRYPRITRSEGPDELAAETVRAK